MVPLIIGLASVLVLAGCLFPPVEELQTGASEETDQQREGPPGDPAQPNAHRMVLQNGSFQDAGSLENAATIGDQTVATERHTHELPMLLVGFTLRFEWDSEAGEDLDLDLRIQRDGETIWTHAVDGGTTGFPDDPIELTFPDLGEDVAFSTPTLLVIDVSAEVAVSTLYEYAGTYSHYDRTTD